MASVLLCVQAMATDESVSGARRVALQTTPPCLGWQPDGQPKGVVLCLHELGMHAGVFDDFSKKMAARGFTAYSIDLRGFGSWENAPRREGKMSIDRTYEDVVATLKAIHKAHPGTPVFVLGEAMGGAMALKVAAAHPELVNGAISSAPGGEHFKQAHLDVEVGSKLAVHPDRRDRALGEEFVSMGTPKESTRQAFANDKLVRLELTPREAMQCQFFMFKSGGLAARIKQLPVLIVQGQKDGMSRPVGAERVFKRLATKDKQLYKPKDGDHYLYEDPNISDEVVSETEKWLTSHLPKT
jgi:alpha-beta hydrolase superfamily lysophospholipase